MTNTSREDRIRAALGKAFHKRENDQEGDVNIENIASEEGVSQDQVVEQAAWLLAQNLIRGPLGPESEQISNIPASEWSNHRLTREGMNWAGSGFPRRR